MSLKAILTVLIISVIGVIFASFFTGQVLMSQVIEPFGSLKETFNDTNDIVGSIQLDTSGGDQVQFVLGDFREHWIPWVIRQASILIGGLSLIIFVYAGVSLIIKGDNEEELAKSTKMIIFGVVGIALAGFSYSIVANVLALF